MKEKIIIFALVLALIILPVIAADDTTVTVKGMKEYNYSIILNVLDPSTGEGIIPALENYTNADGQVTFKFSTASRPITFGVIARQDGRIVINKRIGSYLNYTTGGSITLQIFDAAAPVNYTAPVIQTNTAQQNNTNTTIVSIAENNANNASSGGFSLSSLNIDWKKIGKWALIIAGWLIALAIVAYGLIFGLKWYKKNRFGRLSERSGKNSEVLTFKKENVKTLPSSSYSSSSSASKVEKELEEAQRKIKEAQDVIDDIRNRKQRLSAAERKYEEAKKELEELKDD